MILWLAEVSLWISALCLTKCGGGVGGGSVTGGGGGSTPYQYKSHQHHPLLEIAKKLSFAHKRKQEVGPKSCATGETSIVMPSQTVPLS